MYNNNYWNNYPGKTHAITHHGVKGMKWGVRRAVRAVGNAVSSVRKRIADNAEKRASHPDRYLLENVQRNGDTWVTQRGKANVAKRRADETDMYLARKHKFIVDTKKPIHKMSNDEINKVLSSPSLQKKLSDLSNKEMQSARDFTTAVMLGYAGLVVVSSIIGKTK